MILGFDIGNTNTLMGIYSDDSVVPFQTFIYTTKKKTSFENLGSLIEGFVKGYRHESGTEEKVTGFAFSSVAPEVNSQYHDAAMTYFNVDALEISHKSKTSLKIKYDDPSSLGVDRIVNAEAAFRDYGGNAIIIDLGTAVTFCVLLDDGTFDGGLIAPGIGTTIRALSQRTSKLPEIVFEKPASLVCRDTVNAIKSGFFYGWLSLVEGIINRILREYGRDMKIIFTGGAAGIIAKNITHENIHDDLLTMKGIKYIYDLNRTQ
ncbi:MAG TPA: type III pantothenate kinase [Spirochaetota bacterium]|nr:type III pantothenate kinase [Spirochaetota bacterium]HPI87827.1 type III pantothenate kinase [Spirochaetota bacterium]HPR47441.1 type III pantothenate kinase [Spirochaetota bacterium]